jgi:phosphohistidine phosphatase
MQLHFLRHADAGDPEAWEGPDAVRPLSEKGRKQSRRLGEHLASIGFSAERYITSPKTRALETAEIVAGHVKGTVAIDERLGGPLDTDILERVLADAGDPDVAVIVGHDPDFSEMLSTLTGPRLEMKKGAIARVDIDRPLQAGGGTLRWLIPPDVLKSR